MRYSYYISVDKFIEEVSKGNVTKAGIGEFDSDDDLFSRGISIEEVNKLADFLKSPEAKALKHLDLSAVSFNQDDASKYGIAIAEALKENKSLESLETRNIGYECSKAFSITLQKNTTLQKLDLTIISYMGDESHDEAYKDFALGLKSNNGLKKLTLNCSMITTESARAFAEAFVTNNDLELILNHPNAYTSDEAHAIMDRVTNLYKDAIRDYSKSILMPKIISSLQDSDKKGDFYISDKAQERLDQIIISTLFKGLSKKDLLAFSDHWHAPLQQTKTQKAKDFDGQNWEPLFREKEIIIPSEIIDVNGPQWKLVCLTNPEELKKEGEKLKHCVGGYSDKCLIGDSHIVSVVNNKGAPVSTIEFELNYRVGQYKIKQHHGKHNSSPCPESKAIEEWLKEEIEKRNIDIDYKNLGEKAKERREKPITLLERVIRQIGFNPVDPNKVKKIKDLYYEILPTETACIEAMDAPTEANKFLCQMSNEAINKLRENFKTLINLGQIDLGEERIAGQSKFMVPEQPAQEKKADKPFTDKEIDTNIQKYMDRLFGQERVKVARDGKNIQINSAPGTNNIEDILKKLKLMSKKFRIEPNQENTSFQVIGLTARPFMHLLESEVAKKRAYEALDLALPYNRRNGEQKQVNEPKSKIDAAVVSDLKKGTDRNIKPAKISGKSWEM